MDSSEIRHRNFLALYHRFCEANPHLPKRGMLKLFAERMGLSDRYLSHVKCARKKIGGKVARNIEMALGLQHGWMDRVHADEQAAPADAAERLFLETARTLYRSDPERARQALLELLRTQLMLPK
ncbi:MAG: hypothetical protein K0S28_387 [Paucimonas sp.]|jgi:hypothetical protein|nr:hypothetical protein [Paucimonas sp.]